LRHESANTQFRFVVRSDSKWVLTNHSGDADGTIIAEGDLSNLDLSEGGSNLIKLILRGDRGFVFINGIYITEMDVSIRMNAGAILIGTGFYSGDEIVTIQPVMRTSRSGQSLKVKHAAFIRAGTE
jgi:hypothetical protein